MAHIDSIANYDILGPLDEGGMGALYLVRHRVLEVIRVAKMIRSEHKHDREFQVRIVREARAAIQRRHPNIIEIFDCMVDDSCHAVIIMELIKGVDLHWLIRDCRPSLPLALEIARQSLRALAFLHQKEFIHRDVCPSNLMLKLDVEGRPLVKLIDLGIVQIPGNGERLTSSENFIGKIGYCSPEQLVPGGHVDPRSDLYSFGIVLYQLLTGSHPYLGTDHRSLSQDHLHHPPRDFSETDPKQLVPKGLRVVTRRALAKQTSERFASAEDFRQEIETFQAAYPVTAEIIREASNAIKGGYNDIVDEHHFGRDIDDYFSAAATRPIAGINFHVPRLSASEGDSVSVLTGSETSLLEDAFNLLRSFPVVMLLAQEGAEKEILLREMLRRAPEVFRESKCFRVSPPFSSRAGIEEFFARLGRQSGLRKKVKSAFDWEVGLEQMIEDGHRLFILVDRFEKGPEAGRRDLAGVLRSLSETRSGSIRVVLSGGERLAALKYEHGSMSLLNHAEVLEWPELTEADIVAWAKRGSLTVKLDTAEAAAFLRMTGANPRLVQYCIQERRRLDREPYGDEFARSLREYAVQFFAGFQGEEEICQRICHWLEHEEDLDRYGHWPAEELLRQLYWRNLLVRREGRYSWRCDLLREVGRSALSCDQRESESDGTTGTVE